MRNWAENHLLAIEFVSSLIVAVALGIVGYRCGLNDLVDRTLEGTRETLYGTLASIFASLFGFAVAAVSIILSFIDRERFTKLREASSYSQLWGFFISAIWWLGVSTIASVLSLIFDNDTSPSYLFSYVMVFLLVFASLQVATCIWLLQEMLYHASRPSVDRPGGKEHTSPNLSNRRSS